MNLSLLVSSPRSYTTAFCKLINKYVHPGVYNEEIRYMGYEFFHVIKRIKYFEKSGFRYSDDDVETLHRYFDQFKNQEYAGIKTFPMYHLSTSLFNRDEFKYITLRRTNIYDNISSWLISVKNQKFDISSEKLQEDKFDWEHVVHNYPQLVDGVFVSVYKNMKRTDIVAEKHNSIVLDIDQDGTLDNSTDLNEYFNQQIPLSTLSKKSNYQDAISDFDGWKKYIDRRITSQMNTDLEPPPTLKKFFS